ncbi:hypothetical protein IWW56_001907 [Coemansia sp. RSA 2131]|nr:hypothetical protein IWW56_001907 [Coemansia sp. RSA 2131]
MDWTDNDIKKLVDYVNTNYRGKVSGDWDLVVRQIQGVAANHNAEWTHTKLVDLAQYMWQPYMLLDLVVDLDDVSHHVKLILSLFPGKSLMQLQAQMVKARSKLVV